MLEINTDIAKLVILLITSLIGAGGGFWGAKKITTRSLANKIQILQTLLKSHKRDLTILRSKVERNKRDDQFFRDEYDRFLEVIEERFKKVETYLEMLLRNAMNNKNN